MKCQYFTMGEREQHAGYLGMHMPMRAIAPAMKRHPWTIARERSRGTIDGVYRATGAAMAAGMRRKTLAPKTGIVLFGDEHQWAASLYVVARTNRRVLLAPRHPNGIV